MFADEEFDLDEDFLNDISQKESQYYSQTVSSDEERCIKKFKNDENKTSHSESILNVDQSSYTTLQKNISVTGTNQVGNDKTFRTNSILERLKRCKNTNSDSNVGKKNVVPTSNPKSDNLAQMSSSNTKNHDPSRKNLILEILRRNNVESSSAGPSTSSGIKPVTNNVIHVHNRKIENCKTVEESLTRKLKPVYKPVTLVRQFPGPAGLLPDVSSEPMIPQALLELSDLDETNDRMDVDKTNDSSLVSNYYSQNTTSLFHDGPWQSLINDLNDCFLNGHEISMIKQKVLTNSYKNNKIPFLAGIVQKVDFSRPDPTVVLKDCTGSIEGTICKDILLKYPQSLDIGAVLFLGNVGLLTVGSYLKKFHLVVTMKNIVNIYVGKTKIFNVSEMNAKLEDFINDSRCSKRVLNQVSSSSHSSNVKLNSRPNDENIRINENRNPTFNSQNLNNNYSNLDNSSNRTGNNINGNIRQTIVWNKSPIVTNNKLPPDNSLTNKLNSKIPERTDVDHRSTKSTFQSDNFEDFDDDFTDSFFDIDDNLNSEISTNIIVSTVDKVSTKDSTVTSKRNTVPNTMNLNVQNNFNVFNDVAKNAETVDQKIKTVNKKQSPTKSSNLKLKFSVFRSSSELTPSNSEDIDSILSENNTANSIDKQKEHSNEKFQSNSMSNLLNKENDTDEEIFSQLDIESIVSNYNSLNNVNQ